MIRAPAGPCFPVQQVQYRVLHVFFGELLVRVVARELESFRTVRGINTHGRQAEQVQPLKGLCHVFVQVVVGKHRSGFFQKAVGPVDRFHITLLIQVQ